MCGISGIVDKNKKQIDKNTIQKINDLIIHRGPDDEGFYFGENFAFGHRRLSILDLSIDGHQPMSFLDKYVITYNGEIYNFIEIKQSLEKEGYKFNSQTDTEVILASYDFWGEDCVKEFNGMWAFAIFDKSKNILFCSRDRFGVKPFYYTQNDDKFAFGSEIKQLLEFNEQRFVNKTILLDFLFTGFLEHTNETFFQNIFKLQASHNLIYDLNTNEINIKKYYDISLDENINLLDEEESIKIYEKEFKRAVEIRLRSDVKVGTCLSGGLDSSSVAAFGAKLYNKTNQSFQAIHAKSIEKESDESYFAKIVSNDAKLDLNIIEPSSDDFKKYIDEVIYTQEEPFGGPSIFMQYFVMKKAKDLSCKVMLDGQGGDETLLGYERYYPAIYVDIFRKKGFFATLKAIGNSKKNNANLGYKKILFYIVGSLFYKLRILAYKQIVFFAKTNNKFEFLKVLAKNYLNIQNLQSYEIMYSNLPQLLRYEDKNSMAHSVEARLPFIDFQTLQTALSISSDYKIKDGWSKYILRKISQNLLSKEVVYRKNKLGFNAPNNTWLSSIDLKSEIVKSEILNQICDIKKLEKNFNKINQNLKWRLFNIAVWERVYEVKV